MHIVLLTPPKVIYQQLHQVFLAASYFSTNSHVASPHCFLIEGVVQQRASCTLAPAPGQTKRNEKKRNESRTEQSIFRGKTIGLEK